MNELIIKIGPLFWVLSILAVYALAVVAERILYFHRIQINTGDFLRGISKLVNAGKTDEARHEASILPGPAAVWLPPCWRMPDCGVKSSGPWRRIPCRWRCSRLRRISAASWWWLR